MMKKLILILLAAMLILETSFVFAQDDDFEFFEDDADGLIFEDDDFLDFVDEVIEDNEEESIFTDWDSYDLTVYDYDDITVGNSTPLHGDFFTDMWGNDTSDIDVRHLVHGYDIVLYDTHESMFRFDRSIVSGAAIIDNNEENTRTYLISLYTDLYYSDGTKITASDYAFTMLLQGSPIISELGGRPVNYDFIVGYEDYMSGNVPYISGLKVPAENLISITVKGESLPYFYELSRISLLPYPIKKIVPGCAVYSGDDGAFIAAENDRENTQVLNAALLTQTILDPQTGYKTMPDPVSGPYRIISYDGTVAKFEINPFYKGNEDGKKPRIEKITYTQADNDTMINDLHEGRFALLNKVTKASTIIEGLQMVMQNPQYTRSNYPRIGLTYIYFNPESLLVQEQNVRQAINYCIDTPEFIMDYTGQFSLEMEGLMGMGQWMTNAVSGALAFPEDLPENPTPEEEQEYEERMEQWDELSLDGVHTYDLDIERASHLLDSSDWTLNEDGIRYKEINGELLKLELTMGYYEGTDVEDPFFEEFIEYLAEAGISLTLVPVDFDYIVLAHNDHAFDDLDMLYFGDNFNISYDPVLFFGDAEGSSSQDSLQTAYAVLTELADDMDRTEPNDILEYMVKWIRFQEEFSERLPVIPIYSNVYFDFFTRELDDYYIEEHISWGKAIVPTRMRSLKIVEQNEAVELAVELSAATGSARVDPYSLISTQEHPVTVYSRGQLSLFPEEVREQIPADFSIINEFIAADMNDEIDEDVNVIAVRYSFQTPYQEDEPVYVLFGIPGQGSDVEWIVSEGISLGNGEISVVLERFQWEKLVGNTFAVAVVSK